ncbi:MAG: hypothetical protein ACK5XO_14270, partial [Phycisphaerales bacterium]
MADAFARADLIVLGGYVGTSRGHLAVLTGGVLSAWARTQEREHEQRRGRTGCGRGCGGGCGGG